MSRTDAHRPYWVHVNDHPERVIEHHDHRDGHCTLPAAQGPRWTDSRPVCDRWLRPDIHTCGCPMCTGSVERRIMIRRARASERVLLRAAARGADEAELDTLEGRVLHRARSW